MSRASQFKGREIESKDELIAWFTGACTSADKLLIGVEHEKPLFYLADHQPVPYQGVNGRPGVCDFLKKLAAERGWRPGYEMDNVVELQKNSVNWTLEPGGQVETGGAPLKNVHQTARETDENIREAVAVAKSLGMGMLAIGYHPTHAGKDMPTMPRSRFLALRPYVEQKNPQYGIDGLWCTSAVQVNLGYESEEDMIKKLRVALSLQPIVAAMFANSPFKDGKPSDCESYRSEVIHNYLGGRYGFMLPMAFDKDFGFERFVDYAINEVPMLGLYRDGVFIDAKGGKFSDFMQGKLEACPGQKATLADWENHINTIWPEVRLRRFLEMRGADSGSSEMIKALPAFWVGLLYDKQSLDAVYEMVSGWTNEDREYLRTQTPRTGLQTPFMNGSTTVQEIARNCLALSEAGLKRRAIKDSRGNDESVYLAPLHEIVASGKNCAQRLLERFNVEWKGNVDKVFEALNYEKEPSVFNRALAVPAAAAKPRRQRRASPEKKFGT